MRYLLDTNACSRYVNGHSPKIDAKLAGIGLSAIVLCAVVKAELLYGLEKLAPPEEKRLKMNRFLASFDSLPFDDNAAEVYATIRATLERSGNLIGPNDMMIAAIAVAQGVTLVTHNIREFTRVPGLLVEDWEA